LPDVGNPTPLVLDRALPDYAVPVVRAAFYVRVSTGKQDMDLQLEELHRFAARRDWMLASAYTDIMSGASTRRPGLDRLLADAHAGRFDVVAVWKLDRLGRSLIHMVQVVDDLLGKGVHVVSATEPHMDSTTPSGRLMRNIVGSMAEYERELIRERVGPAKPGPVLRG
jgi:DNA invertase Pin-like site-specific DNA recombinase